MHLQELVSVRRNNTWSLWISIHCATATANVIFRPSQDQISHYHITDQSTLPPAPDALVRFLMAHALRLLIRP